MSFRGNILMNKDSAFQKSRYQAQKRPGTDSMGVPLIAGCGIFPTSSCPDPGTQDPPIAHSQITCARLTTVYEIEINI